MKSTEEQKHYWMGVNNQHYRGEGTIIKMSYPRCFIQYNIPKAWYSDMHEFYRDNAVVQWIDGDSIQSSEQVSIMIEAWEFLTNEQEILESDCAHLTNLNDFLS